MPTIPSSNGQSVAPGEAPGLRAPVEAFGGGQAARLPDVSGLDQQVQQIREHEIQRANQVAVTDAGGQMSALETDALHGPNGVLNKQGRDAFTAPEDVAKQWQDGTAKIEEGLTNDTQKLAFRQLATSHWSTIDRQVQSHVAQQRHAYDNQVTDAAVESELTNAQASFQDPQRGELAIANTRGLLTNFWRRNGHGDGEDGVDVVGKAHIASRISEVRAAVLRQYALAGNDKGASAYFDQHASEFVGKDLTTAQKLVSDGKNDGDGTRAAYKILGLGKQPSPLPGDAAAAAQQKPAGTLSEALKRADAEISDPAVLEKAEQVISLHFSKLEQAQHQDREAAAGRLGQKIANGGTLNKGDPDYQLLAGHPEQSHIDLEWEKKIRPPKDPGDPEKAMSARQLAAFAPEEFLKQGMGDWSGMNTSQKNDMVRLQAGIINHQRNQAISEAHADAKHYQMEYESALLRKDHRAAEIASAWHAEAQAKLDLLRKQSPIADPGTIPFLSHATVKDAEKNRPKAAASQGGITVPRKADPGGTVDLGATTPVTPAPSHTEPKRKATPQMIEWAAARPDYAEHLRSIGVELPAVLPAPVAKP